MGASLASRHISSHRLCNKQLRTNQLPCLLKTGKRSSKQFVNESRQSRHHPSTEPSPVESQNTPQPNPNSRDPWQHLYPKLPRRYRWGWGPSSRRQRSFELYPHSFKTLVIGQEHNCGATYWWDKRRSHSSRGLSTALYRRPWG
jgi:hypothetical protein